jgi:chorismate mutase
VSEEEREYLNETIRNLNNRLVDALRERDEARREVCELKSLNFEGKITPKGYAEMRKWDCFKEDGK